MDKKKFRFQDIPKFTGFGHYQIDVRWSSLPEILGSFKKDYGLEFDPVYQRGHVWTEAQQRAFVEFGLQGGTTGRLLLFNCPNWDDHPKGPMELVDGKQLLTAVLKFLNNDLTVFDQFPGIGPTRFADFESLMYNELRFQVHVNGLETRAEVLKW